MAENLKPPMTAEAFDEAANKACDEIIAAIAAAKARFQELLEPLLDEAEQAGVPPHLIASSLMAVARRLNEAGEVLQAG
jgi:hypothetical protein